VTSPATLEARCPGCGGLFANLPERVAGRKVRCSRCGADFVVPVPAAAPAGADQPAPPRAPAPTAFDDDFVAAGPPPSRPKAVPPAPTDLAADAPPVRPRAPRPTMAEGPRLTSAEGPAPTRHEGAAPPEAPRPAPARNAAVREWQVGDVVLDLYEVTGILGQGGMGRVYRVRHRGWDIDLAVKAPLPAVLEAVGGAAAFAREAETWVNLGLHPHLVTCYYVREVDGLPRVFAELVEGGSLHEWIVRGRLADHAQILDVAIQVAWGLHYAHEAGIVHRDVKPANVMLGRDGVARVTDFGLARARPGQAVAGTAAGQSVVVPGGIAGTPAYLSPEQAGGRMLTRRADLWSWGLSLLEMFRGGRSWEYGVAAAEVLEDHLGGLEGAAMPPPVADLLRRSFREDPEERPHTLLEAAGVLEAAWAGLAGRPYPRHAPRATRETGDGLNNRAVSLLDLGRDGQAEPLLARALEVEPQHLEASYNRALQGWVRGQLSDGEALNRLEEAVRSHPTAQRSHTLLGKLRLTLGEYEKAAASFEAAGRFGWAPGEVERDHALALCGWAALGGEAWLREKARALLESSLPAAPDDPARLGGLAHVLREMGEGEAADRLLGEAASRHPDRAGEGAERVRELVPGAERGRVLKGLAAAATSLAAGRGRAVFAAAGADRRVRVWDGATGASLRTLTLSGGRVRALALTPDGSRLLVTGDELALEVWDAETGQLVRALPRHTGFGTCLAVSGDGSLAVTGASDRHVRVWDLAAGRLLAVLEGHAEAVSCVDLEPSARRGLSGGLDGSLRVWDLARGAATADLASHKGRVAAACFLPGGEGALSGGEDRLVRHWDVSGARLVRTYAGPSGAITGIVPCEEGLAVVGSHDRSVRVLDLALDRWHALARLESPVAALAAGPGPRGVWAAVGSAVVGLSLPHRSRFSGRAVARPSSAVEVEQRDTSFAGRLAEARARLGAGDLPGALKAAREARAITGFAKSDEALALWDELASRLPRRALRGAWERATLPGEGDALLALALDPEGCRVAAAGMSGRVLLASARPLETRRSWSAHDAAVAALAFTPDGRELVTGSWDHTARVWDLASGKVARILDGHGDYVSAVAVSPDGGRFLTGSWDRTLRLWDRKTGRPVLLLDGHAANVSAAAFSPDGQVVVSGGWEGEVRIWDAARGTLLSALAGHEKNVVSVALAPDGRQVASGGMDGTVRLWDPRERRPARVLAGHAGEVTSVAFSPDGRYVASAGRDRTIRLWDASSGRVEATLAHTSAVLALAFLPDGQGLVSSTADGALRLWRLDWELEARPLPEWDDRALPYVETFVKLRLKPETRRGPAGISHEEVDGLLADLHRRGFGGLQRGTLLGKLDGLAAGEAGTAPSYWEEVRRRNARVADRVSRTARAWRPSRGMVFVASGLALAVAASVVVRRPPPPLRLSPYVSQAVVKEIDLIDLGAFGGECSAGGVDHYLEEARRPDVSADTLACVARHADAATVGAYLATLSLDDPDPARRYTRRRNAVSLMAGLGERATGPLCHYLGAPRADARRVAGLSLAALGSPEAARCFRTALGSDDATAAQAAAESLRWFAVRSSLPPGETFDLVRSALAHAAAAVRIPALEAAAVFHPSHAAPAVEPLAADPDPRVAQEARRALGFIRSLKALDAGR
jgi:WD40 repeat protein/serine/threonine protein kinase